MISLLVPLIHHRCHTCHPKCRPKVRSACGKKEAHTMDRWWYIVLANCDPVDGVEGVGLLDYRVYFQPYRSKSMLLLDDVHQLRWKCRNLLLCLCCFSCRFATFISDRRARERTQRNSAKISRVRTSPTHLFICC